MADRSPIEWTEATWNPTTGCDRTSPGCDNCYALALSRRLKAMGSSKYQNDGSPRTSGPGFALTLHPDALEVPHSWRSPRVIFVNSMSDLFHDDVPVAYIKRVFEVMRETPHHTYQVLTKRARRLRTIAQELDWPSNVWMGVSVESDRYLFRVDCLRDVPATVRLSAPSPSSARYAHWNWTTFIGSSPGASLGRMLDQWKSSGCWTFGTRASRPECPSFSSNGEEGRRKPAGGHSKARPGIRCQVSPRSHDHSYGGSLEP